MDGAGRGSRLSKIRGRSVTMKYTQLEAELLGLLPRQKRETE